MKHKHSAPLGGGSYSRQAAGFFDSRRWLDRPLPIAPVVARLAVSLGTLPTAIRLSAVATQQVL